MKIFVSIGTGPGIGQSTAERFAKEGFRIIVSARRTEKTNALVESLKQKGFQAEAHTVDASDPANVATLIDAIEKQYGSIDVLHYNAASLRQASITDQPQDTFVSDLAVNIGGALAAAQAVIKQMAQKKGGTILLTGGGFALAPTPDYLSLSIGKAGIRALAQGLFETFKAQNVHIATVTVATFVTAASKEAVSIGEQFWQLHSQSKDDWVPEVIFPSN